jgi:uncharacterized protein YukE
MPTSDLPFLDEVESTIQQLLGQLPELEEALDSTPTTTREGVLSSVGDSLDRWNQKLTQIAKTLLEVNQNLEASQTEVRSWSETFAQSRQRAEKLRG